MDALLRYKYGSITKSVAKCMLKNHRISEFAMLLQVFYRTHIVSMLGFIFFAQMHYAYMW